MKFYAALVGVFLGAVCVGVLGRKPMKQIELAAIAVDASTQTRASIAESVVADYAERMLNGVQFPAVVLFHDGNSYYIGDGFHRVLASQRNGVVTITSDVRPGTREDALWFALGANREHGHRMTPADKRHAIEIAIKTWPERSARQLSEQVGCDRRYVDQIKAKVGSTTHLSHSVTGKDGKTYPSKQRHVHPKYEAVAAMVKDGATSRAIGETLGVRAEVIANVRRELGVSTSDNTRAAVAGRLETMRTMAEEGHSSRQIAAAVGMDDKACRAKMRATGIDVPADKAIGNSFRHDSNRIIEHMVMDADNITADVNLIEFDKLDRDRLGEWIDGLLQSRKSLDAFIKRLIKEKEKHVEAA